MRSRSSSWCAPAVGLVMHGTKLAGAPPLARPGNEQLGGGEQLSGRNVGVEAGEVGPGGRSTSLPPTHSRLQIATGHPRGRKQGSATPIVGGSFTHRHPAAEVPED